MTVAWGHSIQNDSRLVAQRAMRQGVGESIIEQFNPGSAEVSLFLTHPMSGFDVVDLGH